MVFVIVSTIGLYGLLAAWSFPDKIKDPNLVLSYKIIIVIIVIIVIIYINIIIIIIQIEISTQLIST
jgi:hypothetical protein